MLWVWWDGRKVQKASKSELVVGKKRSVLGSMELDLSEGQVGLKGGFRVSMYFNAYTINSSSKNVRGKENHP